VVAVLRAVRHLKRMGNLARHIAVIARLKHPNPMIASEVRPVLARMSLLASQFAEDAASAIERHDCVSASQLAEADQEVNALRRHLFGILFAADWSHGVEQAVDAALIGRYYERFADHAVAVAAEARYLASCRLPGSPGLEAGSRRC
jgi:phosphate transport system protein